MFIEYRTSTHRFFRSGRWTSQDLAAAIDLHMDEMASIQSRISSKTMEVLTELLPLEAEDAEEAALVDLFHGL